MAPENGPTIPEGHDGQVDAPRREAVTELEVAEAVREPAERIRHWCRLRLLARNGDRLAGDSIERASLISFAVRRGISAEAIAKRCETEDVIGRFVELTGGPRGTSHTFEELAQEAGLSTDLVARLRVAAGLGDQLQADMDDADMARGLALALEMGMPAEALLQLTRVLNDALTRVAETETRLFHFYVHERLRSDGLTGAELNAATDELSGPLKELIEPAILYFHRKAWQRATREDFILHLLDEVASGEGEVGQLPVAVLFADLAEFTPLTEAMGDTAAAEVVERFSDMVRAAVSIFDGRLLKQIGDEFMLIFPSGAQAVACGRGLMVQASEERQFPGLRLGAHSGTALYREGDYVGTTVNVAARVASVAARGQFLVTEAILRDCRDVSAMSVGRHLLKGLQGPIELYEVAPSADPRPVDPVCGMVIDASTCTFTLDVSGVRYFFCSEGCRTQFAEG